MYNFIVCFVLKFDKGNLCYMVFKWVVVSWLYVVIVKD